MDKPNGTSGLLAIWLSRGSRNEQQYQDCVKLWEKAHPGVPLPTDIHQLEEVILA